VEPDQSNDQLVAVMRRAARQIVNQRSIRDLDQTLGQIVTAAVQTVPGADAGGISMAEDGRISSRNPSAQSITDLDELQSKLDEGPCITAIKEPPDDGLIIAVDLAGEDEQRWPMFAPHAVECGYRSMLSTQLSVEDGTRAALNLYSRSPGVFDGEAQQLAGLFGLQAAILLYGSQQASQLQRALDSRDVIGRAKGILMERFRLNDDEAFQMLVRSSQDTNLKLVQVAQWLDSEAAERRAQYGPNLEA
jgi:GAF domain-containing protein